MSTNCECCFIQTRPLEWYYLLEEYSEDEDGKQEEGPEYLHGPFSSFDKAHEDLHENHANPGGHWVEELPTGVTVSPRLSQPVFLAHLEDLKQRKATRAQAHHRYGVRYFG